MPYHLIAPGKRIISQDDKFMYTQNSEDDVIDDDGQKLFSKGLSLIH